DRCHDVQLRRAPDPAHAGPSPTLTAAVQTDGGEPMGSQPTKRVPDGTRMRPRHILANHPRRPRFVPKLLIDILTARPQPLPPPPHVVPLTRHSPPLRFMSSNPPFCSTLFLGG